MKEPSCVALTGLDTFLGRRLLERLSSSGLRVLALTRSGARLEASAATRAGTTVMKYEDGGALASLLSEESVDTFVHLGLREVPTRNRDADRDQEVGETQEVLDACRTAAISRFVIPSSTMCYGPRVENPFQLREEAQLHGHPAAHWVKNRLEIEAAVARFRALVPACDVSVLRHCWVMGPSYIDSFVRYFESDFVPTVLGYDPLLQFVHEEDLLSVFEAVIHEPHDGTFNVVGSGVLPVSGYLRLAGKTGLPLPRPLRASGRRSPVPLAAGDDADGFYDYLKYQWVASGERAERELGPRLYTSQEAWLAMVSSRRDTHYR
ncbi:MAG: UDP-glucose 4-epimerase [Myxococcota bacterium]